MLRVHLTVDVEVWCDGWHDLDANFPRAFESYVYGRTSVGDFGLPRQLAELTDHGLTAVFFVEPLFAARFGIEPLREIVGLIDCAGQEVQMHLHTEWVDEARQPLLHGPQSKRQFLRDFSLAEQTTLLAAGRRLLEQAGARNIEAFRAGSFGFNRDTLRALHSVGIPIDASYNATMWGPESGVLPGQVPTEPFECEGIAEYPMTVFDDGSKRLRHVQLGACSSREIEYLLWQALETGRRAFVLLSHNFELLNQGKTRADPIVVQRMRSLLRFLDRNRDCFGASGFRGLGAVGPSVQPKPIRSAIWRTALRASEQLARRVFR